MLNEEDKKSLAKLIAKELKDSPEFKGMSKSEIEKYKKEQETKDRKQRLEELKHLQKDTLAQRIELEKLKFENTKVGKVLGKTSASIGKVAGVGAELGNALASSKASKSIMTAAIYSNPITALLAENSDMLRAIGTAGKQSLGLLGKGLWAGASSIYSAFRKPKSITKTDIEDSSTGTSLISSSTAGLLTAKRESTRYILAQNATFTGGKNYIMVRSLAGFDKEVPMLNGPQSPALLPGNNPLMLPNRSSTNILKKGLAGISEGVATSNKFLGKINKTVSLFGVIARALPLFIVQALPYIALIGGVSFGVKKILELLRGDGSEATEGKINTWLNTNWTEFNPDTKIPYDVSKTDSSAITKLIGTQENLKTGDYKSMGFAPLSSGWGTKKIVRSSYSSTGPMKLVLPVSVVLDKRVYNKDGTVSIRLTRTVGYKYKEIIIIGLTDVYPGNGTSVAANTLIGILSPNYQIIGDLKDFLAGSDREFTEYMNKAQSDETNVQNLLKLTQNEKFVKRAAKTEEDYGKQLQEEQGRAKFVEGINPISNAKKAIKNIIKDMPSKNGAQAVENAKSKKTSPGTSKNISSVPISTTTTVAANNVSSGSAPIYWKEPSNEGQLMNNTQQIVINT